MVAARAFSCLLLLAAAPALAAGQDCKPDPLKGEQLYLRGGMNGWGVLPEYAFRYSCHAWYLNVDLTGRAEFKISDAAWRSSSTFGSPANAPGNLLRESQPYRAANGEAPGGANNLSFPFSGQHTVKLVLEGGVPHVTIGPLSFAAPAAPTVREPVALGLRFDSRSLAHKRPFGAQPAGTPLTFSVAAKPGVTRLTLVLEKRRVEGPEDVIDYAEVARVPLVRQGGHWQASHAFAEPAIYGYYFEAEIGGKTYLYQNNAKSVYWTRERGANGPGQVVAAPADRKGVRRFRHTSYARDFRVPAWAKDAVYYYIFPERFRNGDRGNDPKVGVTLYQDKPVEVHASWLDKPYRPGAGDGSDQWGSNDFFGGDIAGIIEKLDYIAGLGANTLYMTPLFKAASNHKYDTADYRQIDPAFGRNEDFKRLVDEAAKRGIRVLPDASFNHSGSDSLYFDRFGKYGTDGAFRGGKINPASPYASWYRFKPEESDPNKQYAGWTGVPDLPELDKSSPAYRRFAGEITRLWLGQGTAGWRMDVAPWVPDDFWREWRKTVKDMNPDAIAVAETWFDASKYFLGDTFDSTMNYIFRNTALDYASGIRAGAIYHNIELIRESYPPQAFYALMNVLSTHDVARSLHYLGHTEGASAQEVALAKQRYRLAIFFQMTFPGAPAIYYGDEVGMSGGDDPLNRMAYPWSDQGGMPDESMLAFVKQMTALRKQHAILRHGSIGAPLHLDDNVIVLARKDGKREALTATNNATVSRTVTVRLPSGFTARRFADALDASAATVGADGKLTFTLAPLSGRLLVAP